MAPLNHKEDCPGNKTCLKCGRPGCSRCIISPPASLCVICNNTWSEKDIILHPVPLKDWDE